MRKILLFGAGYSGDAYFEDHDGGKAVYVPAAWNSPQSDFPCEFWVTGCVIRGELSYIGIHGEEPEDLTIQEAFEEIYRAKPKRKVNPAPKSYQVNFNDPRRKSYSESHATEEVEVLVFGEGWDGQTLFVEPYWCLYLATRDNPMKVKTFRLEYYARSGVSAPYMLALRGERPSGEIVDGVIERL
ncbi:Uncharacterised protein [Raoultella terrigena]|uniref:hypothetical protein n=1 Tax=Raoultella terrigena TaxID=577 RepID=UPI000E072909|nr:hypothetical protein [Raoultella terrigena]SUQ58924.1 Uncharacterised protein [Raoultella terrigena]